MPGRWEGDLIISGDQQSAIGTLVERTTRYVLLVHLGRSRTADHVRDARTTTIQTLPTHLNRRPRTTLGWDTPAERLAKLLTKAS